MAAWYDIKNVDEIDSPALLVYPERVYQNIELVKELVGDPNRLRPHIKTNKMEEVCGMMINAGITRFKCATIAEAEMLAMAGAPDILLAYQPVGPKLRRFFYLMVAYPEVRFSCLLDNAVALTAMNRIGKLMKMQAEVFIDLNVGMNRTGIRSQYAFELAELITQQEFVVLRGLHGYDGHIHAKDPDIRQQEADLSYRELANVYERVQPLFSYPLLKVMGGTPSFMAHLSHDTCEVSPGTFVFWDWGYHQMMSELPFQYAALVLCRVISVIDENHICVDLGYKSISAESPLPRVHFLNLPEGKPVAHSEEHLVIEVPDSSVCPIGTVLYGVPVHICPTVALYEKAFVIRSHELNETWDVIARNRSINI